MPRRLTPSRIALTALAISTLVFAIKVHLDRQPAVPEVYAQASVPCGTDPSCGTQNQTPFPGDVNCDGVINDLDIPVMINLVFDCNLCPTCNPLNADANCDGLVSVADIEALAIPCTIPPGSTPTPTPGPNDCCQCDGTLCQVPASGTCPANCDIAFDSACVEAAGCVPNTPTPTVTPTLGPNDCCVCEDNTCAVPSNSACPENCSPQRDSACTASGACVANTPTVTPTPTLGANDCCVCEGNTCSVPTNSACPSGCTPQFDSACTDTGACVANTPTPTRTPTLGPNDCCQCGGVICAVPSNSACPQDCNPVFDSACVDGAGCVPNTVTPTRTPTLGPNDCCVCEGNTCAVPSNSACPENCTPQYDSACTAAGACVANTPTNTPTPTQTVPPTQTLTPTLGLNDCCVCAGNTCSVPSNSACPQDCTPQYDSACTEAGACVRNTPKSTPTPTLGPNDCCVCEGNTCSVPSNSACPSGCTAQYDSACTAAGACVANTPTPTRTRPPGGTATRTKTMTPMIIPFPC